MPPAMSQRRATQKPKQTGSIFALIVVLVLITSIVLMRSIQGALPNPFHDITAPPKDPSKGVDPIEYLTEKAMELIFGPPPHMPKFEGAKALVHLQELLSLGPRPYSSVANLQAADWIEAKVSELHEVNSHAKRRLTVERDRKTVNVGPFEYPPQALNKTYSLSLDNIIVKLKGQCELKGSKNCPSLLVSAHYDAVVSSPGVSDDGIAVSVILEMIKTLADDSEKPLPHSIIFLINNGEECGLLGARHFAKHKFYKSIRASINLEGGGSAGPAMLFRASDLTMLSTYARNALQPYSNVLGNDVMNLGLVKSTTDFSVYTENGESGVDIAFTRHRYKYHTKNDGWEKEHSSSVQHMGDSTMKTVVNLLRNEKFMRGETGVNENAAAPGVYWYEVYGQMAVLPFKYYTIIAFFLLSWTVALVIVGIFRMRNFIAAHARDVKNVSVLSVAFQFKFSLILSFVTPIAVVAVIEQIRPLAIYGFPIATRGLIFFGSLFGALSPFYLIKSAFTTTDVNAYPANEHQEMLNWHVSQLGVLIAWIPVISLVAFSATKDIGMLYVHGIWVLFGCLSITSDWVGSRPWFGFEDKQGDGANEKKSESAASVSAVSTSSTLKNRKGGAVVEEATDASVPTTPALKKQARSNLPNWFPAFGAAIVLPAVSIIHSLHQLLLSLEPTIQDGTPALAFVALISLFVSIFTVSMLPYILTAPNTIYSVSRFSLFVVGITSLILLNQLYEPLTIPADVAPFSPERPLKVAPVIEMDLSDAKNPKTTYALSFNSLALPYLYPSILKPKASKCAAANEFTTRCTVEAVPYKIHGPRIPELSKALNVVEFQEINKNTWTVSVNSSYSRICFFDGVEDAENVGSWGAKQSGVYPYQVWPGTNSHRPNKLDPRVGQAVAFKSGFNEVSQFTVKVNRARIDELKLKKLTMRVGCYIDDLAYLPSWDSLEKKVLPKWAVLIGPGNGAFIVSKKFELDLN
ncbi:hypothetical protein BDR26DRAFT_1010613 [Obelidium mucronatum]|nr:hypothetical protein BDR26DRAFT_1010613 [Obelidium mucronatum]